MPDFKDTRIRFRKGTESEWSSSNPILASGEPGYDLTNNLLKIGDGETNWSNLTGITGGGGGGGLTQSQVVEIVNSGISGVVDGAPSLLNTLNELANALNDDEEFSTTVLNALADKADSSDIYNAAVEWTANHTLVDGTRYLAGDLVYVGGQIYKAKFDNESLPVTNTTYWMNLGSGYRLNIDGRDIQNIPYPVDSVNGQTGDVELSAGDIDDFNTTVSGLLPVKDIVSGSNISVSSISGIFDISTSGVSLDGHGHTAANISDFNSSVSGLLPVKNITSGSGISVTSVSGIYTVSSIITSVDQAQSLVTTVFNSTGSPIPKFKAVYINGGQGDLPTIALASSNGEGTSSKTYAITYEQIDHMSSGRVIVTGALTGVNTDQFNPTAPAGNVNGTTLWLSTSGNLTITKPSAPYHAVSLGTIVRTHQNAGVVEVKVQNGYELNELHNVKINGVANNDVLVYSSGSQLWESNSKVVFSDNTGITGASGIDNIVKISQAAYDNLSSYDPNTIYFVV